jgi:hypothetical protein
VVAAVEYMGIALWDSESDDRQLIGKCDKCMGTGSGSDMGGTCTNCGGSGLDEPREPLDDYLRKAAVKLADDIRTLVKDPATTPLIKE